MQRARALTRLGRRLARLPIDPRLGRMILEADRLGCVREVIVIAAALSLQDPRERPAEKQAQADQQHARFKDETSDFLTWLNLWRHIKEQQRELSSSAFRRMCKREFLNYLRVREWQDFESQLRQVCKEMKVELGQPADTPDTDGIHQALLSGLLSHIGALEERERARPGERKAMREYVGARGARFAIFPGSVLKGRNPAFVMAGELVETSRLWGRQNAAIKPEWAERLGGHLVKRTYSEPHWSAKRVAVMAYEKVTLYGVPLVADRLITFGKVDPVAVARAVHPARAGAGRVAHPARLLPHQPSAARGGRGARAPRSSPRHRGRRGDPLRVLRRPRRAPRSSAARTSTSGGSASAAKRPDLLTFDPEMLTHAGAEEVRADATSRRAGTTPTRSG